MNKKIEITQKFTIILNGSDGTKVMELSREDLVNLRMQIHAIIGSGADPITLPSQPIMPAPYPYSPPYFPEVWNGSPSINPATSHENSSSDAK